MKCAKRKADITTEQVKKRKFIFYLSQSYVIMSILGISSEQCSFTNYILFNEIPLLSIQWLSESY